MVVKVSSNNNSGLSKTAKRVLKKYNLSSKRKAASGQGGSKALDSYSRLKQLVPTISEKDNISRLDVVLEAISYIQRLQGNLQASVSLTSSSSTPSVKSSRQC